MEDKKISLTGIKPSGTPHVGNYLGMIRPAPVLVQQIPCIVECLCR